MSFQFLFWEVYDVCGACLDSFHDHLSPFVRCFLTHFRGARSVGCETHDKACCVYVQTFRKSKQYCIDIVLSVNRLHCKR